MAGGVVRPVIGRFERRVERRLHVGVLELPQRLQPEFPRPDRIRPGEKFIGKFHVLQAVVGGQIVAFRIAAAPQQQVARRGQVPRRLCAPKGEPNHVALAGRGGQFDSRRHLRFALKLNPRRGPGVWYGLAKDVEVLHRNRIHDRVAERYPARDPDRPSPFIRHDLIGRTGRQRRRLQRGRPLRGRCAHIGRVLGRRLLRPAGRDGKPKQADTKKATGEMLHVRLVEFEFLRAGRPLADPCVRPRGADAPFFLKCSLPFYCASRTGCRGGWFHFPAARWLVSLPLTAPSSVRFPFFDEDVEGEALAGLGGNVPYRCRQERHPDRALHAQIIEFA